MTRQREFHCVMQVWTSVLIQERGIWLMDIVDLLPFWLIHFTNKCAKLLFLLSFSQLQLNYHISWIGQIAIKYMLLHLEDRHSRQQLMRNVSRRNDHAQSNLCWQAPKWLRKLLDDETERSSLNLGVDQRTRHLHDGSCLNIAYFEYTWFYAIALTRSLFPFRQFQ